MSRERIEREVAILQNGGQRVDLVDGNSLIVIYRDVPTGGDRFGLPLATDVVVPAPPGYPAAMIDLAGLPIGSPFLARVKGGHNVQGNLEADGRHWQLASYHPHRNGGGPPWNQMRHGFHTYLDHLIAWLDDLS
jgi:hypothetical protein